MKNLPTEIAILFEKFPMLRERLRHPILVSDSGFLNSLTRQLDNKFGARHSDELYRIVYKKDSSRKLMTIQSGELAGLLTSTCVEKGRFSDVAGLEKITQDFNLSILPCLLNAAIYRSMQHSLSYISQIVNDIHNHQLQAEQARFERITEVILDCYKCIPMVSFDKSQRDIQLARLIKANDDCFELYCIQKTEFANLLKPFGGYDLYYGENIYGNWAHPDYSVVNVPEICEAIVQHPVFAIFERLTAGRICEIFLSGNYSEDNISRHRDALDRMAGELRSKLNLALLKRLDNRATRLESSIHASGLSDDELKQSRYSLEQHRTGVSRFKMRLSAALEQKINGLDLLAQMMTKEEIDLYIINGTLLINDDLAVG